MLVAFLTTKLGGKFSARRLDLVMFAALVVLMGTDPDACIVGKKQ